MFDEDVHYYYGISKHNNPISALNTTDFDRILTIDEVEELKKEVEFKEGAEVLVSDNNEKYSDTTRIYLFTDKNDIHHCVDEYDVEAYNKGHFYNIVKWKYIEPPPTKEEQLKKEVEKLEKEYKVKINVKFE